MPMSNKGLSKLIEEAGEVIQVAGKLLAYPDGNHPDGEKNLYRRLEDELGDLMASISFVTIINADNIDQPAIAQRAVHKLDRFMKWDADPNS